MSNEGVQITPQMRAYMKALGVSADQLVQMCFKHWTYGHSLADIQRVSPRPAGNVSISVGDVLSHNNFALRLLNDIRLSIAPSATWTDALNLASIGISVGVVLGGLGVWLTTGF